MAQKPFDRAGACALFCVTIQDKIIIGNIGDSRALASYHNGTISKNLTEDHKPILHEEKSRIEANGGEVYRTNPKPGITKE